MGGLQLSDQKPALAMLALQFCYAAVGLSTRAALLKGMSPRVFSVYRQAIATLVTVPVAYFSRRKSNCSMGLKSFSLIFLTSLIGVTINQNIYFEGLYLASSSMASAMGNLVPAITFVMATIVGMEKINIKSTRSVAKIVGTLVCVSGAISMALLRGPKLLNSEIIPPQKSLFASGNHETWLLGCLFLFASSWCWSLWLILQVPVSANYPDHLSMSAWMCSLATLQSAILTIFIEPDPEAWNFNSFLEIGCCFFSGIIGSGVSFFVQAWCISKKGPLFSAMFNPLCTVVVTILAALLLHEEIYTGSLIGAVGVILGLYIVLWGKAKDNTGEKEGKEENLQIDVSSERARYNNDLEEPLLFFMFEEPFVLPLDPHYSPLKLPGDDCNSLVMLQVWARKNPKICCRPIRYLFAAFWCCILSFLMKIFCCWMRVKAAENRSSWKLKILDSATLCPDLKMCQLMLALSCCAQLPGFPGFPFCRLLLSLFCSSRSLEFCATCLVQKLDPAVSVP
ncbi:WAT1-related protein At4g30420 [Mangifera indica]|uniref:WAT1-related protein At4g30420 n=1 Tax=Mangifera indica TaxID=29780 RepID=UPI001CF953B4|nr:WAT1-related protein At4g30420 [Mangifera indica]